MPSCDYKTLPGRAVETLAFFAYPLAGALLIQLPGLSDAALGTGQAILAAGLTVLAPGECTAGGRNGPTRSAGASAIWRQS